MIRLLVLLMLTSTAFSSIAQHDAIVKAQTLEEEGYLLKALDGYSSARKIKEAESAALNGLASVLTAIGQYDSIEYFLKRSRQLDQSPENLVRNYQSEARFLQARNEYDLALSALQKAKENAEKIDDKKSIATILSSMGSIHFSHNPDKNISRHLILQANSLLDSAIHYNLLARNYGRLANVAMATNDGTTAKKYLDKALRIVELSDNLPVRAYIFGSQAILLFEASNFEEGLKFQQQAIGIKRQLGQKRALQNDLLNISETYMALKRYNESEAAITEGRAISKELKDLVYLKYFYERRSILDSVRGNYKDAYSNYKLAMKYKDSTFSSQHFRDVREIQEKYEAEQKEKIIAEKELEIEHQKYRQMLILGAFLISVLILVVVLIVIRARNRRQQHHLRLQTIVKTQEEVQQRIARDLHDGLVQVLGAAKISLQSIGPDSERSILQKQIRTASDIVDEAVNEARSISHEVLPYSLLKDGLISALEELFARSLPSFKFDHDDTISIDEQLAINIYRIAQELVNNVRKHSESADVTTSIKIIDRHFHFTFSDNGKGFDTAIATKGAGLSNITTRTELIGGMITMRSTPGKGTSTEIVVPV